MAKYRHSSNSLIGLLTAAVLAFSAAACTAEPRPPIVQSASTVVPVESLQDLATYGDVLVSFRAEKEIEIPATEAELQRGKGTTTRQVVASQEGNALWTRPSRGELQPAPPAQWVISDGGWFFTSDEKVPLVIEGRPPLVVGERYLAVRTFSSLGGDTKPEWFSLAYLPIRGDIVQLDSLLSKGSAPSYANLLNGLAVPAVANLLNKTPVDAEVKPYMELDAAKRYQKKFS